ncbi:hypothetical protein HMPREF3192_00248 [Atopobium deltae]|uniref:Uncharacterized protein n=1 Tax=Atopobium deltae TaxID=1393034 RepID=A0A133XWR8_9ACTN|nr:hypothetical protein HMPREF3192_00248 [Atopobium deltae]
MRLIHSVVCAWRVLLGMLVHAGRWHVLHTKSFKPDVVRASQSLKLL